MTFPLVLNHIVSIPLKQYGDCNIVGVTPDGEIYVEEIYSDDGWTIQHKIRPNGEIITSYDEQEPSSHHLVMPSNLIKPMRVWNTMALNFAGARHRGKRSLERVDELVRTLTIHEKIALLKYLKLDILPSHLLGLAESYVLAEATVIHPNVFVVCRRLRAAYVLSSERIDEYGDPYDYDTQPFYVVHFYDRTGDEEVSLTAMLDGFPNVTFCRPMDCMIAKNRLYVADGGEAGRLSQLHIWSLDLPDIESPNDQWHRKLYG